jgi:hypothetical protein
MDHIERLIRERITGADSLRGLANELLVARQLATALSEPSGESL